MPINQALSFNIINIIIIIIMFIHKIIIIIIVIIIINLYYQKEMVDSQEYLLNFNIKQEFDFKQVINQLIIIMESLYFIIMKFMVLKLVMEYFNFFIMLETIIY